MKSGLRSDTFSWNTWLINIFDNLIAALEDVCFMSCGFPVTLWRQPDISNSKVHGANMGSTWVLSPQVSPMLAPWTLLPGEIPSLCLCVDRFDSVWYGARTARYMSCKYTNSQRSVKHYDVIQWKHFPRYCPFVRGIHRSTVDSPHKGTATQTLDVPLLSVWIKLLTKYSIDCQDGHCLVYTLPGTVLKLDNWVIHWGNSGIPKCAHEVLKYICLTCIIKNTDCFHKTNQWDIFLLKYDITNRDKNKDQGLFSISCSE